MKKLKIIIIAVLLVSAVLMSLMLGINLMRNAFSDDIEIHFRLRIAFFGLGLIFIVIAIIVALFSHRFIKGLSDDLDIIEGAESKLSLLDTIKKAKRKFKDTDEKSGHNNSDKI